MTTPLPETLYHLDAYTQPDRMLSLLQKLSPEVLTDLPQNPFIIDAGCSAGFSTLDLAGFFPSATVLGIDLNPRAAEETYGNALLEYIKSSPWLIDTVLERVLFTQGDMFALEDRIPKADLILMANNVLFKLVNSNQIDEAESGIEITLHNCLLSSIQKLKDNGYLILAFAFSNFVLSIVFQKKSPSQISLVAENLGRETGLLSKKGLQEFAETLSSSLQ